MILLVLYQEFFVQIFLKKNNSKEKKTNLALLNLIQIQNQALKRYQKIRETNKEELKEQVLESKKLKNLKEKKNKKNNITKIQSLL